MARVLETIYWKVIPGSEKENEEMARKFAKFSFANLEAIFKFGVVHEGKHIHHVVFSFLWESNVGFEKWQIDCSLNKEWQDWLTTVEDGGQKNKGADRDIVQMLI
jgi:hypothetical protein